MKKFIAFAFIILYFTLVCIFLTEKTDVLALKNIPWNIQFKNAAIISWQRFPYPCYYEIDIFAKNPDSLTDDSPYHLLKRDFSFDNEYKLPPAVTPVYYQIKAHGMFGMIGTPSPLTGNPRFTANPLKPILLTDYTQKSPASQRPFLTWHTVPNAVSYELEILSGLPDNPNGTKLSTSNHLYSTHEIFTHGCQVDLSPYSDSPKLYWRIRALDVHGNPIGIFSDARQIYVDKHASSPQKPLIDSYDTLPDAQVPLYPVYHWIPLLNVKRYEVEILDHPPAAQNTTSPSRNRLEALTVYNLFSCYDPKPYIKPGTYYWRVRGIDDADNTIGTWSDTQEMHILPPAERSVDVATFGDSITHGGGNISYSPANIEYSYQTYLDFPTINLGRSGDTSHTSLERFDHDVLPFKPRNLLILCGSNSLRDESISAQMIIDDLAAIRIKCEQNNIRPVFMTLPPLNPANIQSTFNVTTDPAWWEKQQQVNMYIRTLPYYIDLTPYLTDSSGQLSEKYSPDGLHPDLLGKQIMGTVVNQHKNLFIWSESTP
ncbi:SGNH/GDSL hydrolase family protein [Pectinatus frisingensis]|uniref:SGNH/GDSL hydrolase family protein n=1 Tax=Pectinatus frisingensis TaxID=865 RepID=UPI0018C4ACBE|nr:GDSL-type esterase/lipase family protein [Pectinatus frisingensis]